VKYSLNAKISFVGTWRRTVRLKEHSKLKYAGERKRGKMVVFTFQGFLRRNPALPLRHFKCIIAICGGRQKLWPQDGRAISRRVVHAFDCKPFKPAIKSNDFGRPLPPSLIPHGA